MVCQSQESPEIMSVCHVSFSADVVIPGHCQMHVPVSHSKQTRGSGVLEPMVSIMEQQGLLIARSVCSMDKGGSVIRILNPSPAPVTVYHNQKVGIHQPLSRVEEVCALGGGNSEGRKDQGTLEDAVKLMTSRAEDLSSAERESLQSISLGGGDLGCTDVVKHHIDTGNAEPICQRARKLPFHQRGEIQHLVDQMLSRNIIEPAQGPWASPVVLVKKKDGSTRFCGDFQKVNQVTKKDAQPLPRIDDTLDALKERMQHAYQRVGDHSAVEQQKQKANYDRFSRADTFETGSLVLLHCPAVPRGKSRKFYRPWQGPFKVVKKIGSVVYRIQHLQNPRKRLVIHSNRLKRYRSQREDESVQEENWVILYPARRKQGHKKWFLHYQLLGRKYHRNMKWKMNQNRHIHPLLPNQVSINLP